MWPIQLAPKKDTIEGGSTKHDATDRLIKKGTTKAHKGGYLGMMGPAVNDYVAKLVWWTLLIKTLP